MNNDHVTSASYEEEAQEAASISLPTDLLQMGHDKEKRKDGKHKKEKKKENDTFTRNVTTIAQICMLIYVFIIIYLCFNDEFVFFTWHPMLLSIGWACLMTEGMLIMIKENALMEPFPKSFVVKLHWILQTAGLVLNLTGFAVVYVNKNYLHKNHFVSWHGLLGLIAIICSTVTCLNGIAVLYGADLKRYIKPKFTKCFHYCSGTGALGFGALTVLLSIYTKWFERRTSGSIIAFPLSFILIVMTMSWTLIKPIRKTYSKVTNLFK